ncbi:MAG: WD40 repeat domain-containing protein [Bacteroidia bacterium]|nr:WD40 repeat domain-containing protein [Bacteroidia bacterium]
MENNTIPVAELLHTFTGHTGAVYALCESWSGREFYSGSGDHLVCHWDLDGLRQPEAVAQSDSVVYSLCSILEKKLLIIGNSRGEIHVLDIESKKGIVRYRHHSAGIFSLVYSPPVNRLFAAGGDGIFSVWDTRDFSLIASVKLCDEKVRKMALCSDETQLAIACGDGTIRIVDTALLKELFSFRAHEFSTNAVRYHPEGKYLLSGGRDARLRVWDTITWKLIREIPAHNYAIYDIVFSPGAGMFATGSRDKTVKIWDAAGTDFLLRLDREKSDGHRNSVNCLLWTQHTGLLSGGDDRSVKAWKISPSG